MQESRTQPNMYELRDASFAQRATLALLIGLWVVLTWWLLFGHGLEAASAWFGWSWRSGDPLRRACLAAALSIYYVRLLFTWFVFLKRGVSWKEVFTVAPWVLCIYLLFAIAGGTNQKPLGVACYLGLFLFAAGSWTNSYAEYARNIWKQKPENRGRLYTQGLFRYTRHPNYFGDLISFSGLCLISGRLITIIIPLMMIAGFIFANIPMLDAHLHEHYGATFDDYAAKTRKLIPFIY